MIAFPLAKLWKTTCCQHRVARLRKILCLNGKKRRSLERQSSFVQSRAARLQPGFVSAEVPDRGQKIVATISAVGQWYACEKDFRNFGCLDWGYRSGLAAQQQKHY